MYVCMIRNRWVAGAARAHCLAQTVHTPAASNAVEKFSFLFVKHVHTYVYTYKHCCMQTNTQYVILLMLLHFVPPLAFVFENSLSIHSHTYTYIYKILMLLLNLIIKCDLLWRAVGPRRRRKVCKRNLLRSHYFFNIGL